MIEKHSVVSIKYELRNDAGEIMDASQPGAPLTYLHGTGSLIPGLENELNGKAVGAAFSTVIQPENAYGEFDESLVAKVPRSAFEGQPEIEPGMQFQTEDQTGNTRTITITGVEGDEVTINANHPLAGVTLHFDVEVEGIRDATQEEIDHGHVH